VRDSTGQPVCHSYRPVPPATTTARPTANVITRDAPPMYALYRS
jgi:hypothetical protein